MITEPDPEESKSQQSVVDRTIRRIIYSHMYINLE